MNQRIVVRAIVRKDEKTLLVRRSNGRPSVIGKYELPGGRLDYGEQTEEALARHLREDLGLVSQTVQLFDVVTYLDHDNRDIQYVCVLYLISLSGETKVRLSERHDHYMWKKPFDVSSDEITTDAKLMLGILQQQSTSVNNKISSNDVKITKSKDRVIVYADGGSRGNPGPSASGYIIMNEQGQVTHEGGVYLGITTNNQAEYHGVILGLEKAHEIGAKVVDFRIDSLLVVNQMNGIYHIKNRELWPVNERIRELAVQFDKVTFTHVNRESNQLADGMVNKILDAHVHAV